MLDAPDARVEEPSFRNGAASQLSERELSLDDMVREMIQQQKATIVIADRLIDLCSQMLDALLESNQGSMDDENPGTFLSGQPMRR